MTTITPFPTPVPTRSDSEADFNDHAEATLGAIPGFITETNLVVAEINALAIDAEASAVTATTQAGLASISAAQSAAASAAALAAAGAPAWVSDAWYENGKVVWSLITQLIYRRIVAGAGTTDPSADTTNWALASSGAPQLITVTTPTFSAHANGHYLLKYAGAMTCLLPASPQEGMNVWITARNGRRDNVINSNGIPIEGVVDLLMDSPRATVALRFMDAEWSVLV